MGSKIKNILIFIVIAVVLVLVYVYVFKKSPEQPALISSTGTLNTTTTTAEVQDKNSSISKDFLTILLNVRNIKIDDAIFSDPVFLSLRDSTIELVSDGNEGRPNPFAPLGTDISAPTSVASDLIIADLTVPGNIPGFDITAETITPITPVMPIIENSVIPPVTPGVAN